MQQALHTMSFEEERTLSQCAWNIDRYQKELAILMRKPVRRRHRHHDYVAYYEHYVKRGRKRQRLVKEIEYWRLKQMDICDNLWNLSVRVMNADFKGHFTRI